MFAALSEIKPCRIWFWISVGGYLSSRIYFIIVLSLFGSFLNKKQNSSGFSYFKILSKTSCFIIC